MTRTSWICCLFVFRLDLLGYIFFSMIIFFLLIIFFPVVIGALLGMLKRLVVVSSVWKIHPIHALLGKPSLAREVEMYILRNQFAGLHGLWLLLKRRVTFAHSIRVNCSRRRDPHVQHEVPIVISQLLELAGLLVDDVGPFAVEDHRAPSGANALDRPKWFGHWYHLESHRSQGAFDGC